MSIKTDGSISNRDEETTGGIKIHKLFERSSIAMRLKQNITNNGEAGGNVNLTISKFSGKSSQDIENQKKDRDDEDAALMKNLEKLNKASEQMNVGIQRQKQDADEKAKAALKKQQETQSLLETKLTVLSQEQNSTKQVLETRQVKLKQTTENTAAKKQELVTLKQLKDQMAVSMKDEQDANMIERNQKINELTSQLENFRSQAKEQRTRQQQIEQNTQEVESQRILFTMKLNQLGNELQNQTSLQHTRADYDSSIQESERLQQRLKALQNLKIQADQKTQGLSQNIQQLNAKALGFDSAIDLQKSEANRLALQEQSKQIKSENKELFDMNLTQLNKVKELQVQIQMEETKIAESTEIANLLMDQNKFERMSRNVQVEIESIEDNQRLREDTRKELQTNLKQIFEETDMHNADLEKDVTDFKSVLSKSVDEKQELEDEIRALMAKVCNKRPEELKIEQIDDDYDKLVMYKQDLENFRVKEQVLQDQLDGYGKRFQEYETQLKHQFHSESAAYITENGEIISSIQNDTKAINEKAQQIDSTLREKIAHTEEQMILLEQSRVQLSQIKASTSTLKHEVEYEKGQLNDFIDDQEGNEQLLESVVRAKKGLQSYEISIIDFVVVRKDLMDQNERLKTMTGKNIRDLLDLLDDLGKQIAQLDEALSTDQKEKCQRLIDDGLKLCDSIDNEINQLELRLKNLEQEVPKVSPNEQRAFSEEIQKIKDTLGRLKGKKNILQNSLNEIQQKGDAIVQDKDKLKDILDTLQNIQDKDLKVAEKAVDKVEEKMRVAIRQYKNDKKKECNNQIAKAESKLEDLNEVINNTQAKIDSIARECSRLQNEYDYDDQERNNDIAALRADLQKEQDKLNDLLNNRDKFKEQVDDLKRIAQDLEQNNSGPNFEITNIWQDIIDKTKQLNNNMEPQIKNSLIIGAETDQVKENLAKLKDKYKNKNDLYQQCKSKRQDKQALLDAYQQNIDDIENLLQKTKQQLDVLIPITDNKNFMNQYDAKKNEYEESKFKLEQEKKKLALLQKQLDDTSLIFDALSDDIVQSKQLSKLKDDLDKLDLDINYQSGQAKDLGKDTEELLEKCQDLYQLNKQLKEKEVDSKLTDLQIALGKADKLHKEAMEKLVKYQQLIEKALRSDDEGVVESANKLKQEAAEISSELQFIQTLKDNLRGQEQQLRSKQLKLQANRQSTVKDFDQLSSNFGSINDQAQNMVNDLVRINEDLDNRNVELGDYLTKFNSLQGMYKDFDTMLANISTQHKK